MAKTVLITNLQDVVVDTGVSKILTHTNALVLLDLGLDDKTFGGPRFRAYGFHNEAANLIFDLMLPSFDWSIEPQAYKRSFALSVEGLPGLKLMLSTDFANDLPLDIERFEGEDAGRSWGDVLVRKVLRYYHAPYFIIGQQVKTKHARASLGVEGAVEV